MSSVIRRVARRRRIRMYSSQPLRKRLTVNPVVPASLPAFPGYSAVSRRPCTTIVALFTPTGDALRARHRRQRDPLGLGRAEDLAIERGQLAAGAGGGGQAIGVREADPMPGAEPRGLDADRLTRLVNRDAKRAYRLSRGPQPILLGCRRGQNF